MDEIAAIDDDDDDDDRRIPPLRLGKASRAGGPVTCVCLLPIRRNRSTTTTTTTATTTTSTQPPQLARLWGLGPYLHYSSSSCENSTNDTDKVLLVFPEEKGGSIHGIAVRKEDDKWDSSSSWNAVVYGGGKVAFCNIDDDGAMKRLEIRANGITERTMMMTAADWILDVVVLVPDRSSSHRENNDDDSTTATTTTTVVLGLARNTIELWSVHSDPNVVQVTCQRRIPATPSFLVLSMNIFQHDNHHLWVASGTAFQVIQVWSVPLHDEIIANYRLEGHAGVIHSVQFSPDGRYLASTSDDRSVRLWSYNNDDGNNDDNPWSMQWVGWGHTARIWSVAFLSSFAVVSVAEDATARLWSLESGATVACIQHSSGLWSVVTSNCYYQQQQQQSQEWAILVGATDGTVAVYHRARTMEVSSSSKFEFESEFSMPIPDDRPVSKPQMQMQMQIDTEHDATKEKQQIPRKIQPQVIVGMKWIQSGQKIVVATRMGSIMMWDMERQDWNHCQQPWWTPALMDSHGIAATDGCCMQVFMDDDLVAIGTTRGCIVIVGCGSQQTAVLSAQSLLSIKGLQWIAPQRTLVSFHIRSVALWVFQKNDDNAVPSMPSPTITLNLNTKGVPISCAYDNERKHMLVGDSRGNISLFQMPISLHLETTPGLLSSIDATSSILRVHQKEHVTSIILVGQKIISSGNDGCLHTSYRNGSSLQRGFSMPVWSMSGITKIWLLDGHSENCIAAAGYYGNNYRVVDVSTGYEFFQIGTGGRQRIHDFFLPETGLIHMAVCRNQKDGTNCLMIQREVKKKHGNPSRHYNNPMLDFHSGVPLHRETIFDACFFSLGIENSTNFLLTASEDCGSKISQCHGHHISNVLALTPQESCVRAVCSSQIDKTTALLVVGGGKLALQFFLVTTRKEDGPLIESLDDLRIYFLGKGHHLASDKSSIDQRINAVKGVPLVGPVRTHMVVAGDSSGQCHVNIISEDTTLRPAPGLVVRLLPRPILCVAMSPIVGDRVLLAIGTTAGDVQLYHLPGSTVGLLKEWSELSSVAWVPLATFQAHQIGTNAISLSVETTGETTAQVTIFTGGDDQAVSLFILEFRFASAGSVLPLVLCDTSFTTTVRDASFSAIKGVSGPFHSDCKYFLSAGYTQRLALWRLVDKPCDGKRRLEVVKHLPVDVGDVNTLATCSLTDHNNEIIATVAGLGIEMFGLSI